MNMEIAAELFVDVSRTNMTKQKGKMGIVVKEPNNLRAVLATMKPAHEKRVGMSIWQRDIKAVEEAIALIEAIRNRQ